jgi:hypothetical protein
MESDEAFEEIFVKGLIFMSKSITQNHDVGCSWAMDQRGIVN